MGYYDEITAADRTLRYQREVAEMNEAADRRTRDAERVIEYDEGPIPDNPGYRGCNCEDYPCCGH